MRTCISGFAWLALAAMLSGCASDQAGPPAGGPAGQGGPTQACVLPSGGQGVLRVIVPAAAKGTPQEGTLRLESAERDTVYIWLVPGAPTVEAAAGRVGQVIESEFTKFKATSTAPVTVAGRPAQRLLGSGTEADDGDPGSAEVVVFQVGDRIFIACVHGESLVSSARRWLGAVVQTAQAP